MKELFILNAAEASMDQLGSIEKDPKFRKATRNMMLSFLAIQKAVAPYENRLKDFSGQLGLFLGTGHGELEATHHFLTRFKESGHGSPTSFQNSLHNSTAGFLTQKLRIEGVSLTTSNSYFSGENALDLAVLALREDQIRFALVVGVDSLVPGLRHAFGRMYPEELNLGEGAGAILLANGKGREALAESGPRSRCTIEAVEYSYHSSRLSPEKLDDLGGYYDANFVSLLAQEWAREKRDLNPLFYKPDGTYSRVQLQVRETP
jgi:hypothetical protein